MSARPPARGGKLPKIGKKDEKKVPIVYDTDGKPINPYIPQFIAKAPWYVNTGEASLQHQRLPSTGENSKVDPLASQKRGFINADAPLTKFRKGACDNCGAMTHKAKDCLERPRKVGARWTGRDIQPDEFVEEVALGFDGKRDRWAGYDPVEYSQVISDFERIEAERIKLKASRAGPDSNSENDSDDSSDDEKYAEAVDMPGQKVDAKTRMTVRNLRIREDTAKYLRNLDPDSARYDPKTRSMKENPTKDMDPEKLVYAGDDFVRQIGDSVRVAEMQAFAWNAQARGHDIHPQANPSQVEYLYHKHKKEDADKISRLEQSLIEKYGDQSGAATIPIEQMPEEASEFIEYKTSK